MSESVASSQAIWKVPATAAQNMTVPIPLGLFSIAIPTQIFASS